MRSALEFAPIGSVRYAIGKPIWGLGVTAQSILMGMEGQTKPNTFELSGVNAEETTRRLLLRGLPTTVTMDPTAAQTLSDRKLADVLRFLIRGPQIVSGRSLPIPATDVTLSITDNAIVITNGTAAQKDQEPSLMARWMDIVEYSQKAAFTIELSTSDAADLFVSLLKNEPKQAAIFLATMIYEDRVRMFLELRRRNASEIVQQSNQNFRTFCVECGQLGNTDQKYAINERTSRMGLAMHLTWIVSPETFFGILAGQENLVSLNHEIDLLISELSSEDNRLFFDELAGYSGLDNIIYKLTAPYQVTVVNRLPITKQVEVFELLQQDALEQAVEYALSRRQSLSGNFRGQRELAFSLAQIPQKEVLVALIFGHNRDKMLETDPGFDDKVTAAKSYFISQEQFIITAGLQKLFPKK